jgi:hypothetical protein
MTTKREEAPVGQHRSPSDTQLQPDAEQILSSLERRAAAFAYWQMGFRVLPVAPNGRGPLTSLLPKVKGEATWTPLYEHGCDGEEIYRWFDLEPGANFGVIAGPASNHFAAFDIDFGEKKRSNGPECPTELLEWASALDTPVVLSPSGGLHIWCRLDVRDAWSNSDIEVNGYLIERKQHMKYVLAPPSMADGKPYRFLGNRTASTGLAWHNSVLRSLQEIAAILPSPANPARIKRRTYVDTSLDPVWAGEVTAEGLERFYVQEQDVRRMLPLLGIPLNKINWNAGKSLTFRCPLHEDRTPSATLTRSSSGSWTLKCPHGKGSVVWQLPQVYAGRRGIPRAKVRGGAHAMWSLRLLADAKVITPAPVTVPGLPEGVSSDAQKVFAGAVEIFSLRLGLNGDIGPFPYSQRLGVTWTGLSLRRFLRGLHELREAGCLKKAGEEPTKHKRPMFLYHFSKWGTNTRAGYWQSDT